MAPMVITDEGILSVVRFKHLLKALSASATIEFGSTTEIKLALPGVVTNWVPIKNALLGTVLAG